VLERLVLSGHSNGVKLWGEKEGGHDGGEIVLSRDLEALIALYPKAAGQVQDVMFSACFSIGAVALCVKIFPNLQNAWGYTAYSPSAGQGAERHIGQFEKQTRGEEDLERKDSRGSSALWTKAKGFVKGDPAAADFGAIRTSLGTSRSKATKMLLGELPIDLTFLGAFYTEVQAGLVHPAIGEHRGEFELLRDRILRLRHWPPIRSRFATDLATEIVAGYKAVGLTPPAFATLSRAEVTKARNAYEEAMKGVEDPAAKAFWVKLNGLYILDPKVIPEAWI